MSYCVMMLFHLYVRHVILYFDTYILSVLLYCAVSQILSFQVLCLIKCFWFRNSFSFFPKEVAILFFNHWISDLTNSYTVLYLHNTTHTHSCSDKHSQPCMHTSTFIFPLTHTFTLTCIHTHTFTHIHIQACIYIKQK